ncbi:MAG: hypothetical protein COV07_02530 [Candidatus Vogelbacteria bacterium CG10_big_fil_rev_8_21_14_0_10_45_14]|uniref:Methyltransferase domain-containing protein n=1 Tax=Candidatus Vogelbacteria bacterium CG10_big_fil_rev_8_21_14_0_10_45_14 TaxID=1975042 RepID=A0A2H0RJQ0_9BACT|nr:MAG: hypothetical protein COV07_02530 [Candidatus Vogelbacteria bacterium CG10_big_fil_rev_8_21_14_0_10_45_14]
MISESAFKNTKATVPAPESMRPDFLREQIRLPRVRWSKEFADFIGEKITQNEREIRNGGIESSESASESTFNRYMKGLGLGEEVLHGKKVLDLGAGEGEFVKELIKRGITEEAYGMDIQIDDALFETEVGTNFFRGDYRDSLPISDADYIISFGSVSTEIWGTEDIPSMVANWLGSLKIDGEIRICPIMEAATATPQSGLQESLQKWNEVIAEISDTLEVDCKIEPREVRVTGNNNDIILWSVLIIKKRGISKNE